MSAPAATAAGSTSTRVRYRVVAMATALAMVTYLDRVCIAKLAPDIMRDLELSKVQMGYVFSSFALAYAIFEIPTAWWADRAGTRAVLTRIVVWWSCFTAATAAAAGYSSLLLLRFLFGAGEAGAWPSVARTFSRWIPSRERGTVQGVFFAGAHLVGGLTPPLIVFLMTFMGWRSIFLLFGSVGFVWALVWHTWFRDDPTEHGSVSPDEAAYIVANRPADVPHVEGSRFWWPILRNRNVVALSVMYSSNSMIFYFCITWLPTYLHERHGFEAAALGLFAGLPLLVSVPSDLFGGIVTDRLAVRLGLRKGRCIVGAACYLISAAALAAAGAASSPVAAATLIALATASAMFTLGAAWSTVSEVGRNHVGVVGAIMNTTGQVASLLCPPLVAYSVVWFGSWSFPLYVMGALFLIGAGCWLIIDPARPVFEGHDRIAAELAETRAGGR